MDLSPARWIWFPSQRTLPNTFVLFRREVELAYAPTSAQGWICADSRYRLTVNGQRVQWGPAPSDPRYAEADPVDLTAYLREGPNVIGVEVLFYGHGEGTWPFGKPGLILQLELDGEALVTDEGWLCRLDRAHPPGQFKRSYLRALQEEFDARLHPEGWDLVGYTPDAEWINAQAMRVLADKPSLASGWGGIDEFWSTDLDSLTLSERGIPMLREEIVRPRRLANQGRVQWRRDPRDWFEFRVPGSFEIFPQSPAAADSGEALDLAQRPLTLTPSPLSRDEPHGRGGSFLTFELEEGVVGWPFFEIEASEGTTVELMVQEIHDPEAHPWLDSHNYCWSRFVCREGVNRFECFDFEALRWLQLHVHAHEGPVTIRDAGVRRRVFPWPNGARVRVDEPGLQRLFEASVNTLNNSAQETLVDGMGRERQQYSGDGAHQAHAVRYAFGETGLPARFLRTFAQGQRIDGVWFDSWPAYDRLARTWEREVGVSGWGPLVDHSVGFCFDHYHHWMQTGDLEIARAHWPRLMRFVAYLGSIRDESGLLRVENLGPNAVWLDHDAYQQQRHKQCAFNLYAAAMLSDGLARLADALGYSTQSRELEAFADDLLLIVLQRFWHEGRRIFVNNLPWIDEDGGPRLCDRSLGTALLYDQCPGDEEPALLALAARPPEMGESYPANAVWRLHALMRHGCADVVLRELRERWATLRSVTENNTLQEHWTVWPDTSDLMSHCPLAPLNVLYMDIMGLRPLLAGFERMAIRPQLGDIGHIDLTAYIPYGPVRLQAWRREGGHDVELNLPEGAQAELLSPQPVAGLERSLGLARPGALVRHRLPGGGGRFFLPATT